MPIPPKKPLYLCPGWNGPCYLNQTASRVAESLRWNLQSSSPWAKKRFANTLKLENISLVQNTTMQKHSILWIKWSPTKTSAAAMFGFSLPLTLIISFTKKKNTHDFSQFPWQTLTSTIRCFFRGAEEKITCYSYSNFGVQKKLRQTFWSHYGRYLNSLFFSGQDLHSVSWNSCVLCRKFCNISSKSCCKKWAVMHWGALGKVSSWMMRQGGNSKGLACRSLINHQDYSTIMRRNI